MTEYRDWSITASANTGNAVDGYFKENMAYSDVNDAAREFQAILARDRLDKNGTLVSTGATSSYIVTINATLSAYQDGDIVAFQAHAKNDGASTLTIRHPGGSLSARPMVKTDLSTLQDGDIVAGGTYFGFYKSASANWQVVGVPISTFNDTATIQAVTASAASTLQFSDEAGTARARVSFSPNGDIFAFRNEKPGGTSRIIGVDASGSTHTAINISYDPTIAQFNAAINLNGDVTWSSGAGSPEGAVTANRGSLYSRTDGGAGTTLYVKESGTGNTGWSPV